MNFAWFRRPTSETLLGKIRCFFNEIAGADGVALAGVHVIGDLRLAFAKMFFPNGFVPRAVGKVRKNQEARSFCLWFLIFIRRIRSRGDTSTVDGPFGKQEIMLSSIRHRLGS